MSDKLTEEKIEEMIEQLLSESQEPPTYADGIQVSVKYDRLNTFLKAMEKHQFNLLYIIGAIYSKIASRFQLVQPQVGEWFVANTNLTIEEYEDKLTEFGIEKPQSGTGSRTPNQKKGEDYINKSTTTGSMPNVKMFSLDNIKKDFDPLMDLEKFLNDLDPSKTLSKLLAKKLDAQGIKINDLKRLAEEKNILEPKDFEEFYKDEQPKDGGGDSNKLDAALKSFYSEIAEKVTDKNIVNQIKDKISKTIQYEKTAGGGTRATQGVSSGYNITSRSAAGAQKVDFQMVKAFQSAFPGATDFNSRLTKFAEYVNEVKGLLSGTGKISESSAKEKFSKFITLDLMQQILYSFEASSAGWVFESFLAFMAFGSAIGASYGAGDFEIAGGMEGSAKLLQQGDTSQNIENWEKDKTIRYVIGVKQSMDSVKGTYGPTKQTDRTGRVLLYLVDIKNVNGVFRYAPAGKEITSQSPAYSSSKTRVSINVDGLSPTNTMDFVFLEKNEFEDFSSLIVKDINEDLEKAITYMSNLKANLDDYIMSDDANDKTFNSAEALRNYANLGTSLEGDGKKTGVFNTLKESKMQTLDNLIAEAMRDIKRKTKK